ncbi:hypothetical protein [Spiroplasma turonicum]|uniref:Putative rhomboid-like transmembrane protein n=1 Tax=Spiroplasma turonicum TaxID=216946 RepID=A0A0K1P6L2_9MOLU|nr:hypothetical protein [Spiroplasma turonicum]AKU79497.1 putative rhomboid-like transmembrane protein [Spiroplasma turonicum]ALX70518.1 putative rhomboid-like transmembrane protein [Spiroplasma turonicum]
MKVDFNKLKLNLINYLIKVEKYKSQPDFSNEYATYLVNDKKEYKIIRVTIGTPVSSDANLDKIKSKIKSGKRDKINILNIVFAFEASDIVVEGETLVIESIESMKIKLGKIFQRINKIVIEQDDDVEINDLSNEELYDMLSNPSKSDNVKLKTAVARMKTPTFNSSIIFLLFFVLPIASLLIYLFYFSKYNISTGAIDLFFGAINRNLASVGNQWWRILTYGFSANIYGTLPTLILIFFVSSNAIKLSRYTESLVGQWKFSVATFSSYILAGFFVSTLMSGTNDIFSGPLVILACVVGVLSVTTWNRKADPVVLFSKNRLIFPLILLLLFPFLVGKYNDYVIIIVGMASSASITLLFQYDWKNTDKFLILPIFILIAPFAVAFSAIFIPVASPPVDTVNTLTALQMYYNYNIFNHEQLNNILESNGWYCRFKPDGTIWWF